MTGRELRELRRALGLSQGEFLRAVGMLPDRPCITDDDNIRRLNAKASLRKMEKGAPVPPAVAEKARALMEGR